MTDLERQAYSDINVIGFIDARDTKALDSLLHLRNADNGEKNNKNNNSSVSNRYNAESDGNW